MVYYFPANVDELRNQIVDWELKWLWTFLKIKIKKIFLSMARSQQPSRKSFDGKLIDIPVESIKADVA